MTLVDEIRKIEVTDKKIREFSRLVGSILLLLGALAAWRQRDWFTTCLVAGGALIVLGEWKPRFLRILYFAWMTLSLLLGFVVSRIILTVLFFGLLTPLALISRILGKKYLNTQFRTAEGTYWIPKPGNLPTPDFYERQY